MSDQIEMFEAEEETTAISLGKISFTQQGRVQVAEGDYREFWIKVADVPIDADIEAIRAKIQEVGQMVIEEVDRHIDNLDYRGSFESAQQEVDY